jgi:hypothetical protein
MQAAIGDLEDSDAHTVMSLAEFAYIRREIRSVHSFRSYTKRVGRPIDGAPHGIRGLAT